MIHSFCTAFRENKPFPPQERAYETERQLWIDEIVAACESVGVSPEGTPGGARPPDRHDPDPRVGVGLLATVWCVRARVCDEYACACVRALMYACACWTRRRVCMKSTHTRARAHAQDGTPPHPRVYSPSHANEEVQGQSQGQDQGEGEGEGEGQGEVGRRRRGEGGGGCGQ